MTMTGKAAVLGAIAGIFASLAPHALADDFASKIKGEWMASDTQQNRSLKIYSRNDKVKFEDLVAPGIRLTGSVEPSSGEADVALVYENGYVCRYAVSVRGFRDQGNAVLSFALLSETVPETEKRFRCISGRLEQFR